MQNAAKAAPRRKFIALNASTRKREKFQINNQNFHHKKFEKQQIYPNHAGNGNNKGNSRNC